MFRAVPVALFVAALLTATSASAQSLRLAIKDGLVNLDANGATVRQILDEWARVGGTRVVNGDKVTGGPVTLKLENMPERQALEIILRNVAGYMTAPRAAAAAPGASMYDRILVLPTSSAPVGGNAANNNNNGGGNRGNSAPRFQPPRPADDDNDADEPAPEVDPGSVFTFPQPGQFPGANTGFGQPAQPGGAPTQGNPFAPTQQPPQNSPFGQPQNVPFVPVQPGATPFGTPMPPGASPFGTPVQPGTTPFGTPVPLDQNQGQVPPVFTFTPQTPQPQTQPGQPNGFNVVGTPVPGVVQQPTTPGQTRPPRQQ